MDLFEKAVCFAADKHAGQRRKKSNLPYLIHPMEVASIVSTMTDDPEILAAALLHDTIEDTDTTIEEILDNFGPRVTQLVLGETENKRPEISPSESWTQRKQETLELLRNSTDSGLKMIWLGDKLANMRSFIRMYREIGNSMWERFNQTDSRKHAWYYTTIVEYLKELDSYPAYQEFLALTNQLFRVTNTER